MKKLRPGELRFRVKQIGKVFRVYDFAKASFPYSTDELGTVLQDATEPEIQAECDRLNKKFVKVPAKARVEKDLPEPKKKQKTRSTAQETVEADDLLEFEAPVEEEPLPEVEAYGELSEEERAKMEASLGL